MWSDSYLDDGFYTESNDWWRNCKVSCTMASSCKTRINQKSFSWTINRFVSPDFYSYSTCQIKTNQKANIQVLFLFLFLFFPLMMLMVTSCRPRPTPVTAKDETPLEEVDNSLDHVSAFVCFKQD